MKKWAEKRMAYIGSIKSLGRHLDHSIGGTDLFYIPKVERAIIRVGMKEMNRLFHNGDAEGGQRLVNTIGQYVNNEKPVKEHGNPLNQIVIEGELSGINGDEGWLNHDRAIGIPENSEVITVSLKVRFNCPLDYRDGDWVRIVGWMDGDGKGTWLVAEHVVEAGEKGFTTEE